LAGAKENVELAVLSAIEHAQSTDSALAERSACVAIAASADIDSERSRLYLDLILVSLSKRAPGVLEAAMNSLGYEYQSDFARRYVAQGRAEGRVEGKAEGRVEATVEIILRVVALRFGPLAEAVQARVRNAPGAQLDSVADRVLIAQTLEEVLGLLP
jgi:hypothetical protein